MGGGSSPGEILLSFLYRYSDFSFFGDTSKTHTKTDISEPTIIECDGGEADINPTVKGDRLSDLFGVCFNRILQSLEQQKCGVNVSMLATIIGSSKLQSARRNCIEMASQWRKNKQSYDGTYTYYKSVNNGNNDSSSNFTFSKSGFKRRFNQESNLQRGPRGGLIPKSRPDLDAKLTGVDAIFARGGKNRKNKKKQKRDVALKEFVRASC